MRRLLRNGALALTLAAGAALVSAPASATIQRDGYFGGSWGPIGSQNNRHVQRFHRKHSYYPRRQTYYGPSSYYGSRNYYGPGYYAPYGGIGFGIGIY